MQMNRRSFNAMAISGAAALSFPKLRVRQEVDLHSLLTDWSDDRHTRTYDLTKPWVMGSHAYASDTLAMSRIASNESDVDPETVKIPRETVSVWNGSWTDKGKWSPIPSEYKTRNGDGECWSCLKRNVECVACFGMGATCTEFREVKCEACHGDGYTRRKDCDVCHGRYGSPLPTVAEFGDKIIALEYASLLRRVPGVMWNRGKEVGPVLWRSDVGIEGMIMFRLKA